MSLIAYVALLSALALACAAAAIVMLRRASRRLDNRSDL
ncbi:hypothetical protein Maq22A_1p38525 (plasmid) [Methylobacterium aquaticum]|uniref:Uncharacterized protein n=1 Tax=Methylobacterium aquaticum TaxID=270351 RepID=A0A1Y0ZG10_9HYPH|nr:hypothetical protein Maq22A_1p38525 [Methylobacterium aquaticum]